jgi:EmrB/QacA subfamily drug resistance transporter
MRGAMATFGAIMLATLLAALDQTIVATALPQIVTDLQGFQHLAWVVTAYLVTSTVTIPLYGKLSDLYGRRRLFVVSISIFLAGSALCGLAGSMGQLIAFRAVQGLGAGGLIPLAQATIADLFSPRERGKYQGYVTSMWALAAVAGPLVGGTLTDAVSWRWIFFVNLPLGGIALAVVLRTMRAPEVRRQHRIDYAGAVVLAVAITGVLLACTWGGTTYPWGSPQVLGSAIAGLVLIGVFLAIERRATEPLVPLRLFANRIFAVSVGAQFVIGAILFAVTIYVPVYLQGALGDSATASGAVLITFMAGWTSVATIVGRLIARTGRYRPFPIAGAALALAGVTLLARLGPDAPHLAAAAVLLLTGCGMGLTNQSYIVATQNAVPGSQLGTATAGLQFFRAMGASITVAALGTLLTNRVTAELGSASGAVDLDALLQGGGGAPSLSRAAENALVSGLHSVFLVTAAVAVVGVALALALEERPLSAQAGAARAD